MFDFNASRPWSEYSFCAIDLETTGKYPIESAICELAAVKWRSGEVVDRFTSLIKPPHIMSQEVINIHNITNEMVVDAPPIEQKIESFLNFISDSVILAHHAPFDMGFLAVDFEKNRLSLPKTPALCTSLMARKAIPESPNHRLVTLKSVLNLSQKNSHRALEDSINCLELGLICFERIGREKTLDDLIDFQGVNLVWDMFSINRLKEHGEWICLVEALENKTEVYIVYDGGSKPGKKRIIHPKGLVRNPNGDYVMAFDRNGSQIKRFYLNRIVDSISLNS
ncbi:MAG: exonuclease [Bdellovibrionales bacterium]|nr:exonuclease [Bdellovibrionales bacterium]